MHACVSPPFWVERWHVYTNKFTDSQTLFIGTLFNGAVQRRRATQTITMLTSRRQLLSEVELQRICDICKRWANSEFACIYKKKYGSIHEATLAVRELPVLASCIGKYYSNIARAVAPSFCNGIIIIFFFFYTWKFVCITDFNLYKAGIFFPEATLVLTILCALYSKSSRYTERNIS